MLWPSRSMQENLGTYPAGMTGVCASWVGSGLRLPQRGLGSALLSSSCSQRSGLDRFGLGLALLG